MARVIPSLVLRAFGPAVRPMPDRTLIHKPPAEAGG
jgi:hypothetical protein